MRRIRSSVAATSIADAMTEQLWHGDTGLPVATHWKHEGCIDVMSFADNDHPSVRLIVVEESTGGSLLGVRVQPDHKLMIVIAPQNPGVGGGLVMKDFIGPIASGDGQWETLVTHQNTNRVSFLGAHRWRRRRKWVSKIL